MLHRTGNFRKPSAFADDHFYHPPSGGIQVLLDLSDANMIQQFKNSVITNGVDDINPAKLSDCRLHFPVFRYGQTSDGRLVV